MTAKGIIVDLDPVLCQCPHCDMETVIGYFIGDIDVVTVYCEDCNKVYDITKGPK